MCSMRAGGQAGGRTDKMKLIAAFCNFVNVAEQHLRRFTENNGNIMTEQYSLSAIPWKVRDPPTHSPTHPPIHTHTHHTHHTHKPHTHHTHTPHTHTPHTHHTHTTHTHNQLIFPSIFTQFHVFYPSPSKANGFTTARYWSLSWARSI